MDKLLKLINDNPNLDIAEIADMLGKSEQEVRENLDQYTQVGILRGYKPIINWSKVENAGVTALIELKVIPQKETGFDKVAEYIMEFDEVESLYLMAGSYDLAVMVKGNSIQDISSFVSKRLSTIDAVTSTATHFLLKRYKELGIDMEDREARDIRSMTL